MVRRNCIVCNANKNVEHYCAIDKYDYLRCENCGLIYVNEIDQTKKLYRAYSGGVFKSFRRKLIGPFRRFSHARHFKQSMHRAQQIFGFAASYGNGRENRLYLDIGCNKGFLLAAGLERGWDVYGIEIVPELTVPFTNTYRNLKDHIFNGRFEDCCANFKTDMFDLITAIDVIEHFENVVEDLTGVFKLLRPSAVFVIQTPDAACTQARRLKCNWGALKPLEHLHLFSAENLSALAREIGFTETLAFAPFEEADGNFVAVLRK